MLPRREILFPPLACPVSAFQVEGGGIHFQSSSGVSRVGEEGMESLADRRGLAEGGDERIFLPRGKRTVALLLRFEGSPRVESW